MRSRSISTISSLIVAGLSDSSALNPRPNALLVMSHYLLCQLKIAFCPSRFDVVEDDRLSVTRSFCQTDITWDDSFEDLMAVEVPEVCRYSRRQVGTFVIHRQQQTF